MLKLLKEKILNKKAKIGIIGLGYVGLPLALTFTWMARWASRTGVFARIASRPLVGPLKYRSKKA